jgi:3',5'-cyclic AMP phosphodiesterase CpdA
VTRSAGQADFGFQNNGGLRCDIPQGQITMSTIYQFMPFDNTIVTCDMTGAQLKLLLEQAVAKDPSLPSSQQGGKGVQVSGLKFTYDPAMPFGSQVTSISKSDGTPVDMSDTTTTFKVATNNFMATGGDGFRAFLQATNVADTYILIRDALADAVKNAPEGITAGIEGRIQNAQNVTTPDFFVQVTDLHLCNSADAVKYLSSSPDYDPLVYAAQFVEEVKSLDPSFVVATGDLVALADKRPISKGKEWFDIYNQYVAQPLSAAGITLYNVPGNHDQGGANYSKYKSIDDVPDADKPYYGNGMFTLMTGSQRFYSFDQGDFHHIVLDPDEIKSSTGESFVQLSQEQMNWLQSDLQANASKSIILFFHQPSSNWTNWADAANILSGYNIKMIYDGHWHSNTLVDNGFPEQSTGALCGAWWRDDMNKDGSPYGYRLVSAKADGVHSFYKNLGSSQQIDLITPEEITISGQVPLFAQAYDDSQAVTIMQYRIDNGSWQPMTMEKVAIWYEGKATANITPDGDYHQVEVSYIGSDGSRVSSSKLFKFDSNPILDIKTVMENFDEFRGRYATVAATVTSAMVSGNLPVLQDQSGAMTAWAGECPGCPEFVVGTGLQVRGQVATDGYDVKQLQLHDAADVTGSDIDSITDPKPVTIPEVPYDVYQLVKVQGVKVTQILDGSDFYVKDQNDRSLLIYTGEQSPKFDCTASLKVGDTMDISGIAWIYNGEPEICTRFAKDLGQTLLSEPVKIAVLSDTHYYAPELGVTGAAFEQYLASDRKMIAESKAILESAVAAIKNSDAQIVLVCGDLTKDGELLNHRQFAEYLGQLEDAGKKVFVIDGNHDINNPGASSYSGDQATPAAYTTPADFRIIYEDYGYGEAVAVDPSSLSYAVDPVPGLRIIAMDSALYDTNIADGASQTAGAFSADRQAWIDARIAEGVAKGKTVIGMMHHGVTSHFSLQSQLFPEYVIQNADQVAADLSGKGMKAVFTGHFHAQDITKKQLPDNQFIFDVESGSLVTYPVPYRLVELTPDNKLNITTNRIYSINQDTGGQAFQTYARNFLEEGISGLVPVMLAGIIMQQQPGLTQEQALAAANNAADQVVAPTSFTVRELLVNAMIGHYQGDESASGEMLALYQGMAASGDALTSTLGGALLSLNSDINPADNNIILDLNNGNIEQPALAAPVLVSASTDQSGNKVIIKFDKAMADPAGKQAEFSVAVNGAADVVQSASLCAMDSTSIELNLSTPIAYWNTIEVAYTKGTVTSANGAALESFTGQSVDNNTAADTVSKVTATINGDPATSEGFAWYTGAVSANSDLQVVEKTGTTPDFSAAAEFSGIYTASTNSPTERVHKAEAKGLQPDTTYYYRVGDESLNIWSEAGMFQTAPTSGAFTFIDLTDTQALDEEEAALSAGTIAKALDAVDNARFVALNGDVVETGDKEEQWNWMLGQAEESLLSTTIVPIAGNHEKQTNSFIEHFDVKPAANGQDTTKGAYYSYNYSNAHFIVLNTNDSSTDYADFSAAQLQWLQADVQAAKDAGAQWIIAMLHKGPYTTSNHATDTDIMGATGLRTKIAPVMETLGIDLVLQGHDHIYARSKPIKADGAAAAESKITETFNGQSIEYMVKPDGTIYLIPGTAGGKVYYKNTKISDPGNSSYVPGYYDLFDVADESHAAPYGPDPSDSSRPKRGQIQNFEGITIDGGRLSVISYEIDQNKNGAQPYIIDKFGITKMNEAPGATISGLTVLNGNQQPVSGALTHGTQYYLKWKARKNSDGSLPGLAIVEALYGSQPVFLNAASLQVAGGQDTEYSVLFQPSASGAYTIKGLYWSGWSNNAAWQSLATPVQASINVN